MVVGADPDRGFAGVPGTFSVPGPITITGDLAVGDDLTVAGNAILQDHVLGDFNLYAHYTKAGQVAMGAIGGSGEAGVSFGSAATEKLIRSASGVLKAVAANLHGDGDIVAQVGDATQVAMGEAVTGKAGFTFHSSGRTVMYEDASQRLATNADLYARKGTAYEVVFGDIAGEAGVQIGTSDGGQVVLSKAAAGIGKLNGHLRAVERLIARYNTTSEVTIGDPAGVGIASVQLGADTGIQRVSAGRVGFGSNGGGNVNVSIDGPNRILRWDGGRLQVGNSSSEESSFLGAARFAGGVQMFDGSAIGQVIEWGEVNADPDAPAASRARTFVRDNGAGKTQYCVRFATGAIQVLATEP